MRCRIPLSWVGRRHLQLPQSLSCGLPSVHHNKLNSPFSTRDNLTTIDPIPNATADLEFQKTGAQLSYHACAERWGVS
jgi:hypothetical protein